VSSLNLTTQLFVDGAWTTYSSYAEDGWETSVGPDVESGLQPNKVSFTLANDALTMDPTNPASALYGKIGRNTRARMLIDGTTVTQGEASSWQPERSIEHSTGIRGRASVDVTAEGLLRRLGRWTDPLRSPMTRQTVSYSSLLGFWPLEDASGATSLSQVGPTTAKQGTFTGPVVLAGDDGPGGSDNLLQLAANTSINGVFGSSSGDGWQFVFVAKFPALPTSATFISFMNIFDADGRAWYWQVNNTNFKIQVEDSDGVLIAATSFAYGTNGPDTYNRFRLKVSVSGGTVTYEPAWYAQEAAIISGTTATFAASTAKRPVRWRATSNAYTEGAAYGQVFAVTDTTLALTAGTDAIAAFNGYLGETAYSRFVRLMGEEGLTAYADGNTARSPAMGRQKSGVFLDLIQECARTDGGLIYDHPLDISLKFRQRDKIVDTAPVLALTYGIDVSPPLRKVIDDVAADNDITVTNWDGTEYRVELTSGRLSTLSPPDGVGRYKGTLDVSFEDPDLLVQRGNLQLVSNTLDRPRYPQVTIDLLAFPGLRSTIAAMQPGVLITLAGIEADPVTLLVMNIVRKGNAVQETATLNCVPGDIYDTGEYDSTTYHYDTSTTTLNAGVTSTATTLVFTSTDRNDVWSSTSAYDVVIAGERIGIPAAGMGAQSGSGPYTQTATGVTRSKNGIVKAQSAAAAIHVYKPTRWN
jgi:hypothetical protein